jgi:hypothetical protein
VSTSCHLGACVSANVVDQAGDFFSIVVFMMILFFCVYLFKMNKKMLKPSFYFVYFFPLYRASFPVVQQIMFANKQMMVESAERLFGRKAAGWIGFSCCRNSLPSHLENVR